MRKSFDIHKNVDKQNIDKSFVGFIWKALRKLGNDNFDEMLAICQILNQIFILYGVVS